MRDLHVTSPMMGGEDVLGLQQRLAKAGDGGEPDHIGIVSKYLGNGKLEAIEGNTAVGNDSNGGEVMLRVRHLTQGDGFDRIVR